MAAAESTPLTAPQLKALFDILTHNETYAEVVSFKTPEAIDQYGYPFSDSKKDGVDVHKSSSPLLQLLLTRLVLPIPGVKELDPDFWSVKFKAIMKNFADAELSESYDKGALGTRKTLATAASAFHESITRGMLGGVARKLDSTGISKSDFSTASSLEDAWDHVVHEVVYGELLDEWFDFAIESDDFESHSPAGKGAIDYATIHAATILHKVFVISPEGQYLLKLIESNAATMISGMVRIFLAKVSIGGITNWIGLTQNAADGQNLMQRIIGMVLGWDAGDFKKTADGIRSRKDIGKSNFLATLDAFLDGTKDQHDSIRQKSIKAQESIVTTIIKSTSDKPSVELTDRQHSLLLEYYSAQLSTRDRDKIIEVMCRSSPDHVTSIVRELVTAFDPIIRAVHDKVDLRKYVVNVQKFIDDLLEVNKPKRDNAKKLIPPSIEDYVFLIRRHKSWAFEWLHDLAKGCPDVRESFRAWLNTHVTQAFRQRGTGISQNDSSTADDIDLVAGAGSISKPLRSVFSKLDIDSQQKVIAALDRYDAYTTKLDDQSSRRLQSIVNGLNEGEKQGEEPKVRSMKGPGVYHARWQWLLDETLITPAEPSGPVRHGKDVKDVKARGKTGALASKDSWDLSSIPQLTSEPAPEPPDVHVVFEVLGQQFKDIVADISSQRTR
ncbi:hypothetical protein TruAng_003395 [Truncatella angustata]|nr:hypothetical protein TruAng_003395 [Truncatella angustata]